MAGNKFDAAIIRHITQKYKILIGEKTAEKAKMEIGNVFDPTGEKKMTIRGRHLLRGLPESIEITDLDIYEALHDNAMEIVEQVKLVLESTPPELVGDILSNGIMLTGGGAMLGGLAELIAARPAMLPTNLSNALHAELTPRSRCLTSCWTASSRSSFTGSDNFTACRCRYKKGRGVMPVL